MSVTFVLLLVIVMLPMTVASIGALVVALSLRQTTAQIRLAQAREAEQTARIVEVLELMGKVMAAKG